MIDIKATHNAV